MNKRSRYLRALFLFLLPILGFALLWLLLNFNNFNKNPLPAPSPTATDVSSIDISSLLPSTNANPSSAGSGQNGLTSLPNCTDGDILRYNNTLKIWDCSQEKPSISASDRSNLAFINQDITIQANWINTANPWSDSEVAALTGGVQGSILYKSSTGWTALAPGTSGQILSTQGTGADPLWINGAFALSSNNISVLPGTGLSGGGTVNLGTGGTLTLNNTGVTSLNTFNGDVSILGTANQININNNSGLITLSTPQDIAPASSPTFAGLTLTGFSGVVKALGGILAGGATTSDLPEGTNLYFTDVRSRNSITAISPILYDNSTGVISFDNSVLNTGTLNGNQEVFGTLGIVGQADATQFYIKGFSTQTNNLQEWQTNSGTVLASMDGGGNLTVKKVTVNGTAGNGYLNLVSQSVNPSAPGSGLNLFADSTGQLAWTGADGFVRTFDGSSATASHTYILPDASGTLALVNSPSAGYVLKTGDTMSGPLNIFGSTNAKQLVVKDNGTQTVNLQEWQDSTGGLIAALSPIGYLGLGGTAPDANNVLRLNTTFTDPSAGSAGIYSNPTLFITGNNSNGISGVRSTLNVNQNGFNLTGAARAINAAAIATGNSGIVSSLQGLGAQVSNTGDGTVSAGYGVRVIAGNNSGAGSIGTLYGLYIENQSAGTTNYAIYTNAGLNRLGDQLTITGSQDVPQLVVQGSASQTTDLAEFQNSVGTVLAGFNSAGTLFGGTTANSILTLQGNTATSGNTLTNASLQFKVGDSGGTTALTVLNNGNVGIGDTTPASMLTVGSSDAFQVNSSGNIVAIGGAAHSISNTSGLTITSAVTGLNLQADGSIDVNIAGGSGATGCTVANLTGTLTCTGNIVGAATGTAGYWTRAGTTLSPSNAGDAITTTGNISTSGTGTITSAGLLTGSAGLTASGGTVSLNTTGTSNTAIGNSSGTFALTSTGLNVTTGGALTGVASIDTISTTATSIGFAGAGTLSSAAGTNLNITAGTTGILNLDTGSTGAINIGTSSFAKSITLGNNTGATALNFTSGTGSQTFTSSNATGSGTTSGFVFQDNALTSGTGLFVNSTSTSLTSGTLASVLWNPGSATTTTGDLFSLDVGSNGIVGNILNVKNNGSTVFSVSQSQITNNLPVQFTSPGDVAISYDLNFTNQVSSTINSNAPLYIVAGESSESNDLTLRTYNSGAVVIDSTVGITAASGALNLQVDGTQDVNIAGGSSATGCTVANATGNLTCTGTITGASSGVSGYFTRAGTTLSTTNTSDLLALTPGVTSGSGNGAGLSVIANALTSGNGIDFSSSSLSTGNLLKLTSTSTAQNAGTGLNIAISGANTTTPGATVYGQQTSVTNTGTANTNVAGLFSATGAANNYGVIVSNGSVGIGDTTPVSLLTVGASDAFQVNSSGNIVAIGTAAHSISNVAGALAIDSATTGAINIGTSANAKTITIGNNTGASALNFTSGTGSQTFTSSVASGTTTSSAFVFTANSLSNGTGLYVSSTSANLGTGSLESLLWNPAAGSTSTGDVMSLDVAAGSTIGNILNVKNAGSTVFSVSQTAITANLPVAFNAPGDFGLAYDLQFTNQTSSTIQSKAPLYIVAGESFESNDLTLRTFNSGAVIVDSTVGIASSGSNALNLQPDGSLDVNIAGGSSATGCTITNTTGNLVCTGSITGSSTGTSGFWARAAGALTPGTSTDLVALTPNVSSGTGSTAGLSVTAGSLTSGNALDVSSSSLTTGNLLKLTGTSTAQNAGTGLNIAISGANTTTPGATVYGQQTSVTNTGTANTNVAGLFSASGGANNYGVIVSNGSVGIGDTTPVSLLTVGASDAFQVNASGNIVAIGGAAHAITNTAGALGIDSASTGAINIGTGANAKTITIGNNSGASALAFISGTGSQTFTSANATGITTNSGFVFTDNALSSGTGMFVNSTSTALTTGTLASVLWNPGSATTTTGDLFSLDVGANGTVANILNVKNNGSTVFSVGQAAITANLPVAFTAPGDISSAYDLSFTNPTASYVKSTAPLYIQSGEVFNSSDLTLRTFNSGNIVLDTTGGVTLNQAQNWTLTSSSTTALNIQSGLFNIDTTNRRVGIGTSTPGATLDVLASGTGTIARFNSANNTGCTLASDGTISCSSDSRLKTDVNNINYGLDTVMKLRPVTYDWLHQDNPMVSLGFIAQEVQGIVPNLVSTDSSTGYLQLNTIGFVPILTRAIQDQQDEIAALQAQLGATSTTGVKVITADNIMEFFGNNTIPQLNVDKITINQELIAKSVSVIGDTQFYGAANFNNQVNIRNQVNVGKDTAGKATITTGSTSVSVKFGADYSNTPIVTATPNGILTPGINYAVTNVTVSGFDIVISGEMASDAQFNWIVVGVDSTAPVSYPAQQ